MEHQASTTDEPPKRKRGRPRKKSGKPKSVANRQLTTAVQSAERVKRKKTTATFEDGDEPLRCRGKSIEASRKAGHPVRCKNDKRPGFEVCGKHGARGGRPIENGLYTLGGTRLGDIMDRVLTEVDEAKNLDTTLAMASSLLQVRLDKLKELDTPGFRRQAIKLFDESREAMAANKGAESAALMGELYALLKRGVAEDRAIDRVEAALDRVEKYQNDFAKLQLMGNRVITEKELVKHFVEWCEVLARVTSPEVVCEVTRLVDLPG